MVTTFKLTETKDYYIGDDNNKSKSVFKSSGVEGNLEYVKMLQEQKLTVRITTPYRGIVKGGLDGDFGFSLGNQWNQLASIKDIPLIGDISQNALAVVGAMAGATQASMESLWMTSASWAGYQMPVFKVSMTFLNYSSQVRFFDDMLRLAEGMLPPGLSYDMSNAGRFGKLLKDTQTTLGGAAHKLLESTQDWESQESKNTEGLFGIANQIRESGIFSDMAAMLEKGIEQAGVAAPMNYGLGVSDNSKSAIFIPKPGTTFTLNIGNWFEANNLLMNVGSMNFSKETTRNGSPLLMKISLEFRPYRNISFKEFANFFKLNTLVKGDEFVPKGSNITVDKGGSE